MHKIALFAVFFVLLSFLLQLIFQEPVVPKKPLSLEAPLMEKYSGVFHGTAESNDLSLPHVARLIGADWHRLARALEVPDIDIRQIRHQLVGLEAITILRIWMFLKKEQATRKFLL